MKQINRVGFDQGHLSGMEGFGANEGFGIVEVDTRDIAKSRPLAVCKMGGSLFYPYADRIGNSIYMSYAVARKHIRLAKFTL